MISFPVYVLAKDRGDVTAYSSAGAMQGFMEAIDVENDEYQAWDSTGRLLGLRVGGSKSEWLQIETTNQIATDAEFAVITAKAEPYREPEPLLRRLRRLLGF